MNGFKVRGVPRAVWLALGTGALVVATLAPGLPASATARSTSATARSTSPTAKSTSMGNYLALGDSVAFGYRPSGATPPPNYNDPSTLVGYPEDLGRALQMKVVNASCPGETTGSMIAVGAQSNGCENSVGSSLGYRSFFPLHVKYSGTQLAYAVNYLEHHSTQLVTIDIGANDAFVCEETTSDQCTSAAELEALVKQIKDNLATIYGEIRNEAHYTGPLVALSYYSLNYSNGLDNAESQFLNAAIASVTKRFGGIMANGYGAFKVASAKFGGDPCAAGLLVKVSDGCNIHPSAAGHLLLAGAIAQALGD